jgi:ASPIC and UnbV/FG-GAP-like repeat/FG-GAP repeat
MNLFKFLLACMLVCYFLACRNRDTNTLFETISSGRSGIHFNNTITESDSINPLDVVNIYNGGGVGIGDFNNDGLQDIYFTGNMVPSRLYLNKGNFQFEDITDKSGVGGLGRWARGVSVIDINNDGLMDIYVCNTIYKDSLRRRNILYINQGIDKNGIPHFKDMAAEYGLDIHVQSTMASFFDYDNDGDLDMYLTVNEASNGTNTSVFRNRHGNTIPSRGKLFRNDMDPVLKHPVFHDVSEQAGITFDGFGHSATICDINNDGWKDIYVSDDFISNNILYINNHDGTFTNEVKDYFKHTSMNSMGQDVIDINNDGLPDVVELDMNPEDNYRKKMMLSSKSYITNQNFDLYGYQYQYVRNTLQLNNGPRINENDSVGPPAFSDIAFMSGMAQTDWSWDPLVVDFDNDSYRDLVITNGFPHDVSDHDFIAYRRQSNGLTSKKDLLEQIPQVKLHNYAFHNKGDLTFTDATAGWGLSLPTFSNGAAWADLDNDGAIDLVINNINDEALVYRNTSRDKDTSSTHYLQIKFKGDALNVNGLGAVATIYYDRDKIQVYDNNPYRGYLSTDQDIAHFGLGKTALIDSVTIKWSNSRKQTIKNVKANQVLKVNIGDATENFSWSLPKVAENTLFKDITKAAGVNYQPKEPDFIDFNIQTTLPHKFSEYCPALAAGDIDGDGLDDLVVGGNSASHAQVFLQQQDGKFLQKDLFTGNDSGNVYKDEGIIIFDANGDGFPDIYIASGGYKFVQNSPNYQDRLYINDGKGNFTLAKDALPKNYTSKLCVRAFDYNKDGKQDLFVSGRVDPWQYPKPVSSFIFRNDSDNGKIKFTDVTDEVAPDLKNIGMVCDALFTDFDNDNKPDLVLTGEWMPVTFLKNEGGKFKNVTALSGIGDQRGWWNSIVGGDFRNTGKTDYIIGNVGSNTLYQPTNEHPVFVTAKDFAQNNGYVPVLSLFLPDKEGNLKEFPADGRDDIVERIPSLKKRFDTYKPFANATMDEIFPPESRQGAQRLQITMARSCFLRNDGNGKFTMIPLPKQAQVSTLNGMVSDDFNGDGNLDVAINGNDFGNEVAIGRYDALNGLVMEGDGKGGFAPLSILKSGIFIPGNGRALVKLRAANNRYLIAASQNNGPLKVYELRAPRTMISFLPGDLYAMVTDKNGVVRKIENYSGSSFLSQNASFFSTGNNVASVVITNTRGQQRNALKK